MAKNSEKNAAVADIDRISGISTLTEGLENAAREAREQGNTEPMIVWLRREGAEHARQGRKMEDVVAEALEIAGAFKGLDGSAPQNGDVQLSSSFVASAVQGFSQASGETAGGRARIEVLRGQVEELTA